MPSAAMMTPQKIWVMSASRHCAQVSGNWSMRAAMRPVGLICAIVRSDAGACFASSMLGCVPFQL
jgi:hypothetical protein